MKHIDELLEEIHLREEDYEMFQEEPVTDGELQEIKNRVLEVVRKEQAGEAVIEGAMVTELEKKKENKEMDFTISCDISHRIFTSSRSS